MLEQTSLPIDLPKTTPKQSVWFVVAVVSVGFCFGFVYQLVSMFSDYSESMKAVHQQVTSANEYLTKLTVDGSDTAIRFWREMSDLRRASEQNKDIQEIIDRNTKINERVVATNQSLREERATLEAENDKLKNENEVLAKALNDMKTEYEKIKNNITYLEKEKTGYSLKMEDVKRHMLEAMDKNSVTGRKLKAKYFERVSLISPYYDIVQHPASVDAMTQLCDSILPVPEEKTLYCKTSDIYSKFSKLDQINFF